MHRYMATYNNTVVPLCQMPQKIEYLIQYKIFKFSTIFFCRQSVVRPSITSATVPVFPTIKVITETVVLINLSTVPWSFFLSFITFLFSFGPLFIDR